MKLELLEMEYLQLSKQAFIDQIKVIGIRIPKESIDEIFDKPCGDKYWPLVQLLEDNGLSKRESHYIYIVASKLANIREKHPKCPAFIEKIKGTGVWEIPMS